MSIVRKHDKNQRRNWMKVKKTASIQSYEFPLCKLDKKKSFSVEEINGFGKLKLTLCFKASSTKDV